eukprot:NODE_1467_length_1135_cov_167.635185.p3 GENE.NODE_1467_length_1135_cov_167.635185~~NODE_1467_length_1135_cov_167.635185.p3  ORF type:complete len:302 (+),score=104.48 NODE_1467_length_1135_cov_167.635185:114-1019(+)
MASGSSGSAAETALHGLAGILATQLSLLLLYPIDQTRIRLQVDERRKRSGADKVLLELAHSGRLYLGIAASLQTLFASYVVYFCLLQGMRMHLQHAKGGARPLNTYDDLFASTIAGLASTFLTSPLWVASMRMKLRSTGRTLYGEIREIRRTESVFALWAGTTTSMWLVSNTIVKLALNEGLKLLRRVYWRRALEGEGEVPAISMHEAFALDALAQVLAAASAHPLQVVQVRLRARAPLTAAEAVDKSLFKLLQLIVKREGLGGLLKGFSARALQTVLNAALTFFFYERLVAALRTLSGIR